MKINRTNVSILYETSSMFMFHHFWMLDECVWNSIRFSKKIVSELIHIITNMESNQYHIHNDLKIQMFRIIIIQQKKTMVKRKDDLYSKQTDRKVMGNVAQFYIVGK